MLLTLYLTTPLGDTAMQHGVCLAFLESGGESVGDVVKGGCLVLELVEYDQHELLGRDNSGEGLGGEPEDERGKRSPDGVVQLCFVKVGVGRGGCYSRREFSAWRFSEMRIIEVVWVSRPKTIQDGVASGVAKFVTFPE